MYVLEMNDVAMIGGSDGDTVGAIEDTANGIAAAAGSAAVSGNEAAAAVLGAAAAGLYIGCAIDKALGL